MCFSYHVTSNTLFYNEVTAFGEKGLLSCATIFEICKPLLWATHWKQLKSMQCHIRVGFHWTYFHCSHQERNAFRFLPISCQCRPQLEERLRRVCVSRLLQLFFTMWLKRGNEFAGVWRGRSVEQLCRRRSTINADLERRRRGPSGRRANYKIVNTLVISAMFMHSFTSTHCVVLAWWNSNQISILTFTVITWVRWSMQYYFLLSNKFVIN